MLCIIPVADFPIFFFLVFGSFNFIKIGLYNHDLSVVGVVTIVIVIC